ncbi:MAG TPA: hypothetical protein VG994_05555 [Steroidobacteraceae bacterium]|jgi:hypothetical protein|nr:hypothetical protein [Steroidobacteraceae bacterium]
MSRRDSGTAGWAAGLVLMAAAGLTSCGGAHEPDPATAAPAPNKPAVARAADAPDMVSAVSTSKAPAAVDVKFALAERPVVGKPVDIRLALTPVVELERLYARFQASQGLTLVKGEETGQIERPAIGKDISHVVTVNPTADGIYFVTVTVISDSPTESVSRIYSIPIIAGAGLPELPPPAAQQSVPRAKP